MNAGIAPGVTNLVAADMVAAHPQADELELVFTVSTKGTSGRAGGDFAHRGLTALSRHRTTVVPLPAPFGPRRCLGFAEPDGGWLGTFAADTTVSPYICIAERSVHRALLAANRAGIMARLPRAMLRPAPNGEAAASGEPVGAAGRAVGGGGAPPSRDHSFGRRLGRAGGLGARWGVEPPVVVGAPGADLTLERVLGGLLDLVGVEVEVVLCAHQRPRRLARADGGDHPRVHRPDGRAPELRLGERPRERGPRALRSVHPDDDDTHLHSSF